MAGKWEAHLSAAESLVFKAATVVGDAYTARQKVDADEMVLRVECGILHEESVQQVVSLCGERLFKAVSSFL